MKTISSRKSTKADQSGSILNDSKIKGNSENKYL